MNAKLIIALVVVVSAGGLAYWLGYRQGTVTCSTRLSQYYHDDAVEKWHRNGHHQAWICLEALKDLNAGNQAQATAVLEQHLNEGLLRFLSGWQNSQDKQFTYPQILLLRDAREHRRQRPWTNAEPDEVERLEKAFNMLDAPDKVKLLERIDEVFKPAQPGSAANRGQPVGSGQIGRQRQLAPVADHHVGLKFMEDEEFIEPPPPSPDKVARRAIVLSVVSCRGITEGDRERAKEAGDLAKRSYDWLRALGLEEELSKWEQHVLTSPFGSLADRDKINASWLSEAVVVLAWALGNTELPGFEEQSDPAAAANSVGFLQPTASTVLNGPQLRPAEDLQEYNEFIYNLHWRVRDFSLNRRSYDFESLARKAWGEPVLRHGLVLQDRDLCVGGIPISHAEERAWRTLASITRERHRASNWLIGYASEDFYEVTTDT